MTLKKLLTLPIIVLLSVIIASVYGILHDQLTYCISPEYYTKFKFPMFGLVSDPKETLQNPRLAVALTGIIATWWVGLIIGIAFGIIALVLKDDRQMFRSALKALLRTIVIAIGAGLTGLGYGWMTRTIQDAESYNKYASGTIEDIRSFYIVGCIHNFSYLGGGIGLAIGIITIYRHKKTRNIQA
mgnify:CR=1 FL=1